MQLTGYCQCRRVCFTAQAETDGVELCHCSMCRRATGGIHMASLSVRRDAVTWQGTPATYASSPIATRGFCGHCGTPLWFAYNDSAFLDLIVGAIDQAEALAPATHFGVESRLEAFRHLEGLPEERTDQNERITQRWRDATGNDTPA